MTKYIDDKLKKFLDEKIGDIEIFPFFGYARGASDFAKFLDAEKGGEVDNRVNIAQFPIGYKWHEERGVGSVTVFAHPKEDSVNCLQCQEERKAQEPSKPTPPQLPEEIKCGQLKKEHPRFFEDMKLMSDTIDQIIRYLKAKEGKIT